jgi:cytochrome P450
MSPSYLYYHDPNIFTRSSASQPILCRAFLRREGDKVVCSTAGLTGKYFPYGGGAHICPGRFFAK